MNPNQTPDLESAPNKPGKETEAYKPVNTGGNPFQTPANDGKSAPTDEDMSTWVKPDCTKSDEEEDKGDSNRNDMGL